jgi:hypothetical protein
VGHRFRSGELDWESRIGRVAVGDVQMRRVFVGEMWATGSDRESWIGRVGSGEFLLETCGPQVQIRRVGLGESDRESSRWRPVGGRFASGECLWRDVGHRFELGGFLLDRCGPQVRVGRVFVG